MNQSPVSDEELRSYLLNSLPQPSRARLEERYLADDETYERLLAVEEELIDEYVRGLLSSCQGAALKKSLLLSKDGPERLRFARTIDQLRLQNRRSVPRGLAAGLRLLTGRKTLIPAAIAATALLVFLTVLPESARRQSTNHANGYTAPPPIRSEPHVDGVPSSTVTLWLHSISRDRSTANVLRISSPQESIRLEAEFAGDEHDSYGVAVRRVDGGQIQTPTAVRKRPTEAGTVAISAEFSADSFQEGDYIFTIFLATGTRPAEEIMAYTFTVVRTPPS